MKIYIIGISGAIGGLLANRLRERGDAVAGLVRRPNQQEELAQRGIDTTVGELEHMSPDELALAIEGSDAIVYTAGSNGGAMRVTKSIDGEGVDKTVKAATIVGVDRFVLVSVFPESWRERDLGEELEYYFVIKKEADVAVTRSSLDWVILRPSLLLDDPARETISLGPCEIHNEIPRDDVAATVVELLHEPRITRQILELDGGTMPIAEAVMTNIRGS